MRDSVAERGSLSAKNLLFIFHYPSGAWCAKRLLYVVFVVELEVLACSTLFVINTIVYV